jgi:hypothetical protein
LHCDIRLYPVVLRQQQLQLAPYQVILFSFSPQLFVWQFISLLAIPPNSAAISWLENGFAVCISKAAACALLACWLLADVYFRCAFSSP